MTTRNASEERWQRIAAAPDETIDLAEAALLIAADEYRNLDVGAYLERFDEMAGHLRRRLPQDISAPDALIALNRYLFDQMGFTGNAAEYYDPRNSFLNDVLDRRLGIPITLSIVYIEVGRRIGLPLHGVSFPGHFLVKCVVREGTIVLDPYSRGVSLGLEDLSRRLSASRRGPEPDAEMVSRMLAAAGKREILVRMLRNLAGIYRQRRAFTKALAAAERIVMLAPQAAEEYRERGMIYLDLECFRAALDDFRRYLGLKPRAPDAPTISAKVAELQRVAARLN